MVNVIRSASRVLVLIGSCAGLTLLALAVDAPRTASSRTPATLVGQSATSLPDGNWLLLGGHTDTGQITGQAVLVNSSLQQRQVLPQTLNVPRTGQSATVLPDGTVLVIGGTNASGQPVADLERYQPSTRQFEDLGDAGLDARTGQTATLLSDGRLLIVGGTDVSSLVHSDAEFFDPTTGQVVGASAGLTQARTGQQAELLPSGNVLIWGGHNQDGAALTSAELYNVATGQFQPLDAITAATLIGQDYRNVAPAVSAATPEYDSTQVSVDARLSLRFSKPLQPDSLTDQTVTLLGPSGAIAATVTAAEGGMLAFVTPKQPLLPATSYTLFLRGAQDSTIRQLPFTAVPFQTVALTSTTQPLNTQASTKKQDAGLSDYDGELWLPTKNKLTGVWRSGQAGLAHYDRSGKNLPKATAGVTAVAGEVLRLNGAPLAHVTLSIGNKSVVTDAGGKFLLSGVPSGTQTLVIDGTTANTGERQYGRYEYLATIKAGETNPLPFVIWMTRLDTRNAVSIASPTTAETVVTNPRIPGLELHIPAGTVIRDSKGNNVTQITVTAIPVDQPPFPLPNHWVPVYFTIQPGGAHLQGLTVQSSTGARLIYPNFSNAPAGMRIDFWNYDAVVKGWYVYGQGTVSANRKQIIPDPGVVIYEFTGAMVALPSDAPATGPVANGCISEPNAEPNAPVTAGDPVDCFTGLYVQDRTDLNVRDVLPVVVHRTYRPLDTTSHAFGIGTNLSYDLFIVGDTFPYTYQDLILPDGSRIHYPRTSSGTGYTDAVYTTQTPGPYYGSTISWNTSWLGTWLLKLPNGTVYAFPESYLSSVARCAAAIGMKDRYSNTLTFVRDSNCNLTSITSPNLHKLRFTYDTSNRITQASDDTGRTVTYGYDSGGRLASATDPAGKSETYTYDSSNRLLTVTDKRGNVTVTNAYDSNSRVTQQTYADNTTSSFNYTLNGSGVATQMTYTDERGAVKQVQFNAAGYPTSITHALGKPEQETVAFVRDATTNLAQSMTDALGRVTAYQYNSNGKVTQITYLSGTGNAAMWAMTYEPTYGQLASVTDPATHTNSFGYDGSGNLVSATDGLGNVTSLTYNGAGQVISATRTAGGGPLTTSLSYNGGALATVTDPLNRTIYYFNDALGRPGAIKDPLGNLTRLTYDVLDRVTQTTDPLGNSTQFAFDANGNLVSLQDPRGNITAYTFDTRNRRITMTDPLTHSEAYSYDAGGNLAQATDRNGQVTGFSYDFANRLISAGFGASASSPSAYTSTIAYTWDAGDRLIQAADSISGTVTRSYDGLDHLLQEQTPQGQVTYTYNPSGLRQSMTVQGQSGVNYSYDNANRLTQITQGATTVSFSYDSANRRTSLTLPNGIQVGYSYDSASELTGIAYQNGGTAIGNLTYSYDAGGRRVDMGGSLAQVNPAAAVASATYDAANRLTNWAGTSLTYDNDGNLNAFGASTFIWDARNQLTATSDGGGSFAYDAFGRRIGRTVGGATNSYSYDGLNPVTINSDFLLGGQSLDERYARVNSSGTTSYLTDGLGSTVALTNASATTTASYSYAPYGSAAKTGTDDTPLQFTGRDNDGTSNLYYYRARYYSPQLGRFISQDPLGFAGGINTYAYTNGNPVSYRDPTGKDPLLALIGAVGGFGYGYVAGLIEGQSGTDLYLHALEDAGIGGLTGLTDGLNLVPRILANAGINAVGEAYKEEVSYMKTGCPREFNGTKIALAGFTSVLGDLGGNLAGHALAGHATELTHILQESSLSIEQFVDANINGALSLTAPIIDRAAH